MERYKMKPLRCSRKQSKNENEYNEEVGIMF